MDAGADVGGATTRRASGDDGEAERGRGKSAHDGGRVTEGLSALRSNFGLGILPGLYCLRITTLAACLPADGVAEPRRVVT